MPLYEYQCEDCQRPAELLVRADDTPECPTCGSERLTKLLSVVSAPGRDIRGGPRHEPPSGPSSGSCGTGCGCFPGS